MDRLGTVAATVALCAFGIVAAKLLLRRHHLRSTIVLLSVESCAAAAFIVTALPSLATALTIVAFVPVLAAVPIANERFARIVILVQTCCAALVSIAGYTLRGGPILGDFPEWVISVAVSLGAALALLVAGSILRVTHALLAD